MNRKNGELVDEDCEFSNRYRLVETIEKARPRSHQSYEIRLRLKEELRKIKGDSYRITLDNVNYNFHRRTPTKEYSFIYNYSADIKKDWLTLLKECERMLNEGGIIQDESKIDEREDVQDCGMRLS